MMSFSDNNQANAIVAHNTSSRNIDDFLNIDNPYFKQMVSDISHRNSVKTSKLFLY